MHSPPPASGDKTAMRPLARLLWTVVLVVTIIKSGGATGRALDLRSTGRGFKSYSGQKLRNNLGQVVHTYVPLSPSNITWYRAVMLCGWEGNRRPGGK